MREFSTASQSYFCYILAASLFLTSCLPAAQGATLSPSLQQQPGGDDAGNSKVYLPVISSGGTPAASTPTATATTPSTVTATATPTLTPTKTPSLELNTIGNQIAKLGVTLKIKLSANNPNGGTLTYSIAPLPLPLNASFNPTTGEFSFKPDPTQIGEWTFTFSVSNGQQSDSETIKINVPQPPANGATTLSGRILDANEAAAGRDVPLVGATVRLMNSTPMSTTTASDGSFHFTGVPEGEQYFEYDGSSASSSVAVKGSYGAYRGQKGIIAHVDNEVERPIYIMKIDMAGQTVVTPSLETIVTNPNISVTLDIPANTVMNDQGQLYSGPISVSPVPDEFTPASLPNNLNPSRVLTIQPMGLTFQQAVPITFPNVDKLSPGSIVNIWSMDHKLGKFFIAGKGRVTEDGQWVETIEGGVREASWHFILALLADIVDTLFDNNRTCSVPSFPSVNPSDGCLQSTIRLPSYNSIGNNNQLLLSYMSQRAWPSPILPFEATLPMQAAVPNQISYELRSFGGIASSDIAKYFIRPDSFQENRDERFRGALAVMSEARTVNAAELSTSLLDTSFATGIYPWTIRLTNHYGTAQASTDLNGRYQVVNEQNSPLGAGWGVAGLQRVYPQADGSVFLVNGDGSSMRFRPPAFNFAEFSDLSQFVRNGSAAPANTTPVLIDGQQVLRLSGGGQSQGSAFLNEPITLASGNQPTSFSTRFDFQVNDPSYLPLGGDGMTFAFVTDPSSLGAYGGYLGYAGITPSVAVEFDTYPNGWDPNANHIGINSNGNIGSIVTHTFDPNIPKGTIWSMWIDYNGQDKLLEVRLATDNIRPSQPSLTHTIDLLDTLGQSTAYIGFTAGTAAAFAHYDVRSWEYNVIAPAGQNNQMFSPAGDFSTLARLAANTYTRRMKDGTLYTFDASGLQTAVTDRNGNKTAYRYDGNGRLTNIVDPAGLETILTYNGVLLQSIKDPMGRTTIFEHNSAGDLTKVTFPDGSNRQFGYDSRHLMTSETDERGKTTTRLYDDYGRLISAELPEDVTRSTTYAQKVGLITNPGEGTINNPAQITRPEVVSTTVKDGEKHRTIYTFGPLQSIASVVDPAGFKTTIERNADGNPTKFTYPSGQVINQEFESNGNLKIVNDPTVQGTTTFSYEPLFNQPQTIKDAFGNVTTLSYDGKGNPIQILSPLQRSLRMAYDTHGLPMVMTDTLGTVANFSYNNRGDLTQMKWGSGAATRTANFTYTPHGYLQNMSDPLLRPFAYRYDDLGRLISETLPSNRTVIYQYDAAGNLTSLTPPGRPAHSFEYDGLGMMTGYTPPAVNGVANPKTSYAYNKAQQLTQLTRPDGKLINYSYDSAGRLTTIQASRGNLNYSYSPTSGQLSAINAPDNVNLDFQYQGDLLTDESWSGALNGTVQRSYDKGYRTASLSVNGVAISYQYDADNAPTKAGDLNLSYQPTSGLLANSTLGTVNDSFGYNAFAELQSYSANAGATPLFQTNYARDALGRITTLTETITSTTFVYVYGYDPAGRLATVQRNGTPIASYGYDANGNRLSASDSNGTSNGSYDNQDRLLSYGNTTYSYTANGELTSKKIGNNPATTYSYDEFGNLLSVKLPNNETISYLVDGKDRRIGRKLNGVLQKGWIYEDQLRPVAELDGSGAVSSRFVYATRINVPDYMVKGGVTYRLILDHLGSVRLVVNTQTGEVVQRMDYDAWGVVTQDTNPGFQPFGFAGGLWDGQTGLVRFGARDYDARVGRWTSKDPIGFEGGEPDLYTYVANQPVDISDSSGLEVYLCRRPADMPFPFNLVDHHWIKTSTYEAGMGGMNGNVPGQNGNSDWPYSQTRTNDHLGQSQAENSTCVKIPNANEECVNSLIKPGQPTGRWTTQNQCQSFAQSVIEKCGGDYPGVCNPYILAKVGKCVKAYWR